VESVGGCAWGGVRGVRERADTALDGGARHWGGGNEGIGANLTGLHYTSSTSKSQHPCYNPPTGLP
jgi:hypothetical protein